MSLATCDSEFPPDLLQAKLPVHYTQHDLELTGAGDRQYGFLKVENESTNLRQHLHLRCKCRCQRELFIN